MNKHKKIKCKYIFDNEEIKKEFHDYKIDISVKCIDSVNSKNEYHISKIGDVYDKDNELEYTDYTVNVYDFLFA